MSLPSRQGLDGLNENVHNFIVNIYARGGILQITLFLYFIFQFLVFIIKFSKSRNLDIRNTDTFVAFFDGAMENAFFNVLFFLR